MVIDLKYHLTTIIAIFFALGIGILVGSAMIGDDGIVREQQKLIVQIEDDLKNLRSQNNQFRAKVTNLEGMINEQEEFVSQLFQDAIADELDGLKCMLVNEGEDIWPQSKEVMGVLEIAGVDVIDSGEVCFGEEQGQEQSGQWDFCVVLASVLPSNVEKFFLPERIVHPTVKEISTKKGLYQFVKSLEKLKLEGNMKVREESDDLSTHTGF